jgi:hypothetical protein
MNKNEALFLSLKEINRLCDTGKITGETINTIQAIKAALEAKDEPVVWNEGVPAMLPKQKKGETFIVSYEPKLEAKDEPIATKNNDGVTLHLGWDDLPVGTKLYATPPQRKPLTDEEITDLYFDGFSISKLTEFARAIEAAHGIKGEA